jgi:hypothetical protein
MANREARKWWWVGAGVVCGAALARWQLARWFTPQPSYELEQRIGDLEIRVYDAHWVAETTISDASWEQALDEGLRRLARYVFGDNRPSPFQSDRGARPSPTAPREPRRNNDDHDPGYRIPMPVPTVARVEPRRETIATTSPVNVSTQGERSYTIAFNLPKARTLASLPAPNDERVRLERRPRRRVAVTRFRGAYSGPHVAAKFSELLTRVRKAGLGYRGSPEFAGYDPPSTLPFLRRNEIWVELDPN